MDCVNIYEDAPVCCKDLCLNCDSGYCMSDLNNITPNEIHCAKFIGSCVHQEFMQTMKKKIRGFL